MKIFVTGASGLLGSNLVRSLVKDGHHVRVLLHSDKQVKGFESLPLEYRYGSIMDEAFMEDCIKGCDVVIHAAASTAVWPKRSSQIREINIRGTQHVIDGALSARVRKMIFIGSASSVSEPGSEYQYIGEKFGLDYIDSKYEALQLVQRNVQINNLPAVSVLPTYMIGPYDSKPSSGKMILALATGKLKFYTGGGRNFVHVDDVVQAIKKAISQGEIGKCYVAGGQNMSYREFFSKVATITDQPAPKLKVPNWIVKFTGLVGSFYGFFSRRQPLISYPLGRMSCEKQFVDTSDTISELQLTQTNIDTAIHECYQWFRNNQYC